MPNLITTTGCAPEQIEVAYDVEDGLVEVKAVMWNGLEASGLLTDDVNADIEMECATDHRKRVAAEIVEFNLDRGQKLYEDMRDMREAA